MLIEAAAPANAMLEDIAKVLDADIGTDLPQLIGALKARLILKDRQLGEQGRTVCRQGREIQALIASQKDPVALINDIRKALGLEEDEDLYAGARDRGDALERARKQQHAAEERAKRYDSRLREIRGFVCGDQDASEADLSFKLGLLRGSIEALQKLYLKAGDEAPDVPGLLSLIDDGLKYRKRRKK